jgi:hypothetical protein
MNYVNFFIFVNLVYKKSTHKECIDTSNFTNYTSLYI